LIFIFQALQYDLSGHPFFFALSFARIFELFEPGWRLSVANYFIFITVEVRNLKHQHIFH
jgi:hypothetical protein